MSLAKQFKTSPGLEENGVDLQYGLSEDGNPIRIKIRRASKSNKKFRQMMKKKMAPHTRALQLEAMDPDFAESILQEVYAHTIVVGWENVDIGGEIVPYSPENCIRFFEEYPDLWNDIQKQSTNLNIFREEVAEIHSKN